MLNDLNKAELDMIYENNIYLNGTRVLSQKKKGRKVLVHLDNGSIIQKSELCGKEIEIECLECHRKIRLKFYEGLLKKKYTCQKCLHIGERNPFYGKKHSQEFKDKMSKERKGVWCIGEKNPMYGIDVKTKMSSEKIKQWKQHISEATRGEKNPMYGKNIKDYMSEEAYSNWKQKLINRALNLTNEERKRISDRAKEINKKWKEKDPEGYRKAKQKAAHCSRSKQWNYKKSKIEEKVEEWLKNHNVDYDYSCIIGFGENCFQYDFIIHNKRILIEVQGDYWHANPKLYNEDGSDGKRILNYIQKKKIEKDIKKKEFAESKNFKVIYIWESDINNCNYKVLDEIIGND